MCQDDEDICDAGCSEMDEGQPAAGNGRFCINCTGRMAADEDPCEDCGHCPSKDEDLFSAAPSSSQHREAVGCGQKVALLYDDRMELHDEGGRTPHPERPDRIRAVVARLLSTGLGGEPWSVRI